MINLNIKRNSDGFTHTPTLKKAKLVCGFTLLEALVAISILMIAVVAPITIAQKGLSSAVYTKNQMVASYLAQDAIEFIKNRRDQATINNKFDWAVFWEDIELCTVDTMDYLTAVNNLGCQVDTITPGEINNLISEYDANNPLKKDTDGFYQYANEEDTSYTRQVKVLKNPYDSNNDEALLNVVVRWSGSADNLVDVSTLIYNY